MKFLIKNRLFLPILKNEGQFMVNNGGIFRYKQQKTVLEVNFIILKTMFNPFSFIFVILELKFFLSVAQRGHEAKHKLLKKMLHIGDNVAHQGVAHWVHPVYIEHIHAYANTNSRETADKFKQNHSPIIVLYIIRREILR